MGGYPLGGIRWARRAYQKAVELYKEKHYDVVLTRSPSDISHIVGYKLKQRFGMRWIANWNDPVGVIWPSEKPPYLPDRYTGLKKSINNNYTKTCLTGADFNTFPAQTLLDYFKSFFPILNSENSLVIPHIGLSETLFASIQYEKKKQFRLCHAGNLTSNRNPELLFRTIRELIDEHNIPISLDIMGVMDGYVSELVKKYSLEDNVYFIGSYPYIEVLNKMGNYDVLILLEAKMHTGIYFASKIVDYAQVGRPIFAISPSTGFAKSTISQYGGGVVVNNEDFQDIKNGLLRLYAAWQTGELIERYNTKQLYSQFSSNRVVRIYNSIVKA
jgi:glycosyltransferase involved in cell wall biosynthesis